MKFLAWPYYSQRAVFAFPLSAFFICDVVGVSVVRELTQGDADHDEVPLPQLTQEGKLP